MVKIYFCVLRCVKKTFPFHGPDDFSRKGRFHEVTTTFMRIGMKFGDKKYPMLYFGTFSTRAQNFSRIGLVVHEIIPDRQRDTSIVLICVHLIVFYRLIRISFSYTRMNRAKKIHKINILISTISNGLYLSFPVLT